MEIGQIKEYQVFKDFGKAVYEKNKITNAPEEHQKIRVHFVFDIKHCGKFKARLVADGHLTKEPMETVYSGVVSIGSLRLTMFLAELNNLELWGADVGNAYLQALTREKLYIVGGPEFEELQGHVLVMYKALYGTRSGGACWHDKFFDIHHDMSFKPSKADPDIWMKPSKFSWVIVRTVIEVINGVVLFVLHPLTQLIKMIWPGQLQDCLEDILELLLEFLLGFQVGVLLGFTHWCFGNVARVLMLKL